MIEMTRRVLMVAVYVVTLIACADAAFANEAHRQLMARSEKDRQALFFLVLVQAGEICQSVKRTFFQGQASSGHALWNIDCGDGNTYSISIAPDAGGSTKLLTCREIKLLAQTECFKRYPK